MKKNIINNLILILYFIPSVFRIVFPVSIDEKLTINVFSFPFMLYDFSLVICYLIMIIKENRINKYSLYTIIFVINYFNFQVLINKNILDNICIIIYNNFYFLLPIYIILFLKHIKIEGWIKNIFYFIEIYLILQVILYGFGIFQFKTNQNVEKVFGIMRIYTTAGAATGTSIILFLLFIITDNLEKNIIKKNINFIITFTIIVILQSKSAIIIFIIIAIYKISKVFYKLNYKKIIYIIFIIITIYLLSKNKYILEYIFARFRKDDLSSGRTERFSQAIKLIKEKIIYGYGVGVVYPIQILQENGFINKYYVPIHNMYLLFLAENGIIGIIFYIILILINISNNIIKINCEKKDTIFYTLLLLIIFFNTEAIMINIEYVILIFIIIRLIIK